MRDLRTDIRNFSEPIKFFVKTETIVNGTPTYDNPQEYLAYGDVMVNFQDRRIEANSLAQENTIKVRIRQPHFPIATKTTELEVRGVKYVVTSTDPTGMNSEDYFITGKELANG